VDVTSAEDLQVDALNELTTLGDTQVGLLERIARAMEAGGRAVGRDGYAKGGREESTQTLVDPTPIIERAESARARDAQDLLSEVADMRRQLERLNERIATGRVATT
jgi:hypothetical protein